MKIKNNKKNRILNQGFSLIEIMIVMAVVGILMGYLSLNLLNSKNTTDINTSVYTFITDFKNQQTKSMVGDTEGRGVPDTYGIYFLNDRYILFNGVNYAAENPANFTVSIPDSLSISTTFPSAKVVFSQGSGEITPFTNGANQVTITNTSTGQTKTLQFNKYGIITSDN